jgi:hypothetical protein
MSEPRGSLVSLYCCSAPLVRKGWLQTFFSSYGTTVSISPAAPMKDN